MLFCVNAIGQTDSLMIKKNIKEVMISATKTSQNISKLPIPVLVISEKEIKQFEASTLYDLIVLQTGILSVPTRIGTQSLQMQGLDAAYTTILIDGFPIIGRSFGALDLNRISVSDIKKIEVVKGPFSSLYGSNALGGIINLITKNDINDGSLIMTSFKAASHNTTNSSLIYQHKKGFFQISNSLDYNKTDGYDLIDTDLLSTVNPYSNLTFRSNIKFRLSDKLFLNVNGHGFKQEQLNTSVDSIFLLEGQSDIKEWSFGTSVKYLMSSKFSQELEIYKTNYKANEFLNDIEGTLFEEKFFHNTLLQSELKLYYNYKKLNSILGFGMKKEELSRRDFCKYCNSRFRFYLWTIGCNRF